MLNDTISISEEAILKRLVYYNSLGYHNLKTVEGSGKPVFVGLHTYLTTVGLVVGITDLGYERRYCYQNPSDALIAIVQFEDPNEHASGNWIKCKGRFQGQPIDLFNPEWIES